MFRRLTILASLLLAPLTSFAEWNLDNSRSHLTFVSVKAVDIAEVHRFTVLDGNITDKGEALVVVDVASLDTMIPIRNERMLSMLFDAENHPLIEVTADLEKDLLEDLMPGTGVQMNMQFTLYLLDQEIPVMADVAIERLSETAFSVTNTSPVIIEARSAGLGEGVEELRKVANLPSISNAVPVNFYLQFVR